MQFLQISCSPSFAHLFLWRKMKQLMNSSALAPELVLCMQATFYALQQTYGFLSPELWRASQYTKAPLQEFTDFLAKPTIDAPKPVDNTPTY